MMYCCIGILFMYQLHVVIMMIPIIQPYGKYHLYL